MIEIGLAKFIYNDAIINMYASFLHNISARNNTYPSNDCATFYVLQSFKLQAVVVRGFLFYVLNRLIEVKLNTLRLVIV